MVVVEKVKNASGTAKLIATTIVTIVVAWIGAWQTVKATNNPSTSLNNGQVAQVRTLIQRESPVTEYTKNRIIVKLNELQRDVTVVQIQSAVNNALLHEILKNTATTPK